jgi:small-conductance mechanosensitive channel
VTGPVSPQQWIVAIAELGAGVVVAVILRIAVRRLAARARGPRWLHGDMLPALSGLLPWAAAIAGLWAAALTLPLGSGWRADADHALLALTVLAVTLTVARLAGDAVQAGATARSGVAGSATIFVNITRIAVLAIGLLVLLDGLGVAITPLLTALGVGGLAVALALQDTLTNLFAGIHILAAGKVQPGDFIQLDNGMQGHVVDTNWRNTTICQLPNNLVIVPNATLASSVVTNYHQPEQEVSVTVQVGVAYESDLEQVERVTIEVGREIMQTVEGAVPAYTPVVRYHTFGDSSVNFSVILRAAVVTSQYVLIHEFIKRLHNRYRAEGIEIPYPTTVLMPAEPERVAPAEQQRTLTGNRDQADTREPAPAGRGGRPR